MVAPLLRPLIAAFLLAVPLALAAESAEDADPGALRIIDRLVAWGHETPERPRRIDTIILHSTYYVGDDPYSIDGVLEQFETYGVTSHYLIARDGTVYRLARDADIAYHAGKSEMPNGRTGINSFSLGIEVNNTKTVGPTAAQYAALVRLVEHLQAEHPITAILAHSAIAPDRKTDPWAFDWSPLVPRCAAALARCGVRVAGCGCFAR